MPKKKKVLAVLATSTVNISKTSGVCGEAPVSRDCIGVTTADFTNPVAIVWP